jgi:hypothetical protein
LEPYLITRCHTSTLSLTFAGSSSASMRSLNVSGPWKLNQHLRVVPMLLGFHSRSTW